YAPEAEALLDECADVVRQAVKELFAEAGEPDVEALQRTVRRAAGRFVNDRTKRKPMIVPVVMEACAATVGARSRARNPGMARCLAREVHLARGMIGRWRTWWHRTVDDGGCGA